MIVTSTTAPSRVPAWQAALKADEAEEARARRWLAIFEAESAQRGLSFDGPR